MILIPNINTWASECGSHDLSGFLICRERATSAIWWVSCKLWRHDATHTLVPTAATSCKSPFAIRKTSFRRRSMHWRLDVIVFSSESVSTPNSRIRYSRSNFRCYTITKVSWNFSRNAFSRHSRSFSVFNTVGLRRYRSRVARFFVGPGRCVITNCRHNRN